MKRRLSEVIEEIGSAGETGLLSIALKDSKALFKIFFKEGVIYHVSCSNLKITECLSEINEFEFSDGMFLPHAKINVDLMDKVNLADIIQHLNKADKVFDFKRSDKDVEKGASMSDSFKDIKETLLTLLVRQIGPVGIKIFPKIVAKWGISNSATKEGLSQLINLLAEEIEDTDNRKLFIKEAMKTI